jgi:hypothetical protein
MTSSDNSVRPSPQQDQQEIVRPKKSAKRLPKGSMKVRTGIKAGSDGGGIGVPK